jgi:hypothetical protein
MSNTLKVCTFCSTQNYPASVICKKCGSRLPGTATSSGVSSGQRLPPPPLPTGSAAVNQSWFSRVSEEGLWGYAIVSFLFPLIGLILYLVNRDEPFKASVCGSASLTGVLLNSMVGAGVRGAAGRSAASDEGFVPAVTLVFRQ